MPQKPTVKFPCPYNIYNVTHGQFPLVPNMFVKCPDGSFAMCPYFLHKLCQRVSCSYETEQHPDPQHNDLSLLSLAPPRHHNKTVVPWGVRVCALYCEETVSRGQR